MTWLYSGVCSAESAEDALGDIWDLIQEAQQKALAEQPDSLEGGERDYEGM